MAGPLTRVPVAWTAASGATARFADGTVSGWTGCNRAEPDGVMEQEQAYLSALPSAAQYTVEGSTLSLLTAEGTFVAVYQDG